MAFSRPTLQELVTRVEGDIKAGLGLVTLLRRSFLKVIARVLAGLAHVLFGFLKFIEKQAFPDTSTDEWLLRWCAIFDVPRKEATYAEFVLDVTGTAGVVVPAGRPYRRTDGAEYTTLAEVTLTGTGDTITLVAVIAGALAGVLVGDVVTIVSPIAGLDSAATVSSIITEPSDLEDIEALRARLMNRIQNPPSGGAANDYLQWAAAVAGVTRAWVGPQALGPGTVVVYFVTDASDPITPSAPKIQEVVDYIEVRRPVTANVSVVAPVLLPLDLTIQLKPNTADVRAAVTAEIQDMVYRDAALAGAYKSPGVLHDGKILLSHIEEAISISLGETDHVIVDVQGIAPADVTPATGELIVLGAITWQTLA